MRGKSDYYYSFCFDQKFKATYPNRLDGKQCIGINDELPYYICRALNLTCGAEHDFDSKFLIPFNKKSFSNTKADLI